MKSIFFGLSLVGAAAAQIVNGVSMVSAEASPSAASASEPVASTSVVTPTATPASGPADVNYGASGPPAPTPAPAGPPPQDFYQIMPYSQYQSGGYQNLDCGYGHSRNSQGYCMPESWVRTPTI